MSIAKMTNDQIIYAILRHQDQYGRPPVLREIAFQVGLTMSPTYQRLQQLQALGIVERIKNSKRTWRVVRGPVVVSGTGVWQQGRDGKWKKMEEPSAEDRMLAAALKA